MPRNPDPLRRQISSLQLRRRSLESKLLEPQALTAGSLVERFLGRNQGEGRRAAPTCYLSRSLQGRSKLTYVKKEELDQVRRQCEAYRAFQHNLRQWRRLTEELEGLWKRLRDTESE